MKTQQKITWIRYSLIGVIISIITMAFSCKKVVDSSRIGVFFFINNTQHNISYQAGLEKYNLKPNTTITIEQSQEAGKTPDPPTSYNTPFEIEYAYTSLLVAKTPIIIKFNANRCWDIKPDNEHTPLNINNFVAEKLSERKYKFTYTFTEADYNRAVTCP